MRSQQFENVVVGGDDGAQRIVWSLLEADHAREQVGLVMDAAGRGVHGVDVRLEQVASARVVGTREQVAQAFPERVVDIRFLA